MREVGMYILTGQHPDQYQAGIGYHLTSEYSVRNIGNKEFEVLKFTKAIGKEMDVLLNINSSSKKRSGADCL